MKYFIKIIGQGGDFGCGSITREQYEFWSSSQNKDYLADALQQNLDDDIDVPKDAEINNYYNEYSDIGSVFGLYEDSVEILVTTEDNQDVFRGNFEEFYDTYNENDIDDGVLADGGDELYVPFDRNNKNAYVFWKNLQKGIFINVQLDLKKFDPLKLKFICWDVQRSSVITEVLYDGETLDIDASGMRAYSFEASLHLNN